MYYLAIKPANKLQPTKEGCPVYHTSEIAADYSKVISAQIQIDLSFMQEVQSWAHYKQVCPHSGELSATIHLHGTIIQKIARVQLLSAYKCYHLYIFNFEDTQI
jgi:hypothetical protein